VTSIFLSFLFFFCSLKAKMSSTHFIYFTYTRNSLSSPYIYYRRSNPYLFMYVYFKREEKKRETII
jgi:hypothetical protein